MLCTWTGTPTRPSVLFGIDTAASMTDGPSGRRTVPEKVPLGCTGKTHLLTVTLALGGPDGGGPWPFGAYLDSADRAGLGINVAYLTGHNTIRQRVMGTANRAPSAAELQSMTQMVGQAMHEGAFGLSTGLRYIPGFYSKTDEVIALSKVAADSGGIYTSHLREEGLGLLDGVAEALEIGRQAHIPIVLTHHKAIGQ